MEEKKVRKLSKVIEGTVVNITESETGASMSFDFAELPAEIQAKLGPYGLSQKLGDAAAGKSGQEAVDAIMKVYEGLAKGDWTVRAPAEPKITKKDIMAKLQAMPESPEKDALKAALANLGFKL